MGIPFNRLALFTILLVLFIIMTGQEILADEARVVFGVG